MKFSDLHTVIWAKAILTNVMKSWQMWTGYLYLGAGALYDYMPAFRHALGRHYDLVFVITGILLVILRFKTRKPIIMPKEAAVEQKLVKDEVKKLKEMNSDSDTAGA